MKKIITLFISAMLFVLPMTNAFAQGSPEPIKEKARNLASELVSKYGASGVQYAIMDHGNIVLTDSVGVKNKATNEPITKDTMFGIGSISKMYVSAATMMLVDAHKVDIDQPLTTYIKDFTMADERYKKITPRMLLNHSSGLYGAHLKNSMLFNDNDTENHDELLLRLQSETLKSNPGEYSVYSNDGFQLLEILVERVSGLSYTEFLRKNISAPLDLKYTKTPLDPFDRQMLSKTYFPAVEGALPVENANVIGTGGLYSTAEELAMFAEVLMGNRTDILSAQSAKSMQSHEYRKGIWVPEETNSFNYGLGWDAVQLAPFSDYGITALSKGGDTVLYHSALIIIPEHQISMAVLSSGGSSILDSIFASNVLLELLKDKGIIKDIIPDKTFEPPVKVEMPSDLLSYSGIYGSVGTTINVEIKNGEFDLPALEGFVPAQKYVYTGDGQFKSSDGSVAVSFDKQKNGKTYIKANIFLNFTGLGQMVMVTYEYQKHDANPLNTTVQKAWEHRNGKNYYALDEKISSIFYLAPSFITKKISVDHDGYASGTKIVNENKAVNAVEIPVMNGRDAFDLNFNTKDGSEYLTIDGQSYISEDAVKPILGGKSVYTILSNGQATWFKIDKNSANKTMTVDFPTSGGLAVYDENGAVVDFSTASHNNSVVLPQGGLIVLGGNAGDVFKINLN
ncbi:serine hydrolase [Paenibacillus kribbensis]|uniref:Serine hydrolase n=1 Tax=Paenibacillus kribbensis TaxID=172713 RepID=A0A222WRG2_9BACL|nr:serine hydrolase domain-containing protein [Paenibacillus kribbensis]ASR49187.1 serine hydrolase [Paenibacillus kribbensis]